MSLSVPGGGSAQMQSHWKGQALQGCGLTAQRGQPNSNGLSQGGRSASVSQAKPNMRSKDAEWTSEFSNVLTTAVTCCQTELWFIQQICFHTGKLKHLYRLWLRTGEERPFGSSTYTSRHMCTHVCATVRKQLYSQWRFYPWFLQLKSTTTYLLFWLYQTWHFKSLFSGLRFFFFFFSSFFL